MRTIYYAPKDKTKPVEKYVVDDIDALDALRLHADEYSEHPPAGRKVIDKSAQPVEVKPELLPQGENAPEFPGAARPRDA